MFCILYLTAEIYGTVSDQYIFLYVDEKLKELQYLETLQFSAYLNSSNFLALMNRQKWHMLIFETAEN